MYTLCFCRLQNTPFACNTYYNKILYPNSVFVYSPMLICKLLEYGYLILKSLSGIQLRGLLKEDPGCLVSFRDVIFCIQHKVDKYTGHRGKNGENIVFDSGMCPVASSFIVHTSSLSHRLKIKENNIVQPVAGRFRLCWLERKCEPRAVDTLPVTSHASHVCS